MPLATVNHSRPSGPLMADGVPRDVGLPDKPSQASRTRNDGWYVGLAADFSSSSGWTRTRPVLVPIHR